MFVALERYIPLFENYISSKDKHTFLAHIQDPTEKILLEILQTPLESLQTLRDKLKKANLSQQLKQEIEHYKLFKFAQQAKEFKEDQIFSELDAEYGGGSYEYSKPAVLNTHESKEGENNPKDSQLELPKTLQAYLEQKRNNNALWIKQINDYGFSKIDHSILLKLSLTDKEYVLQKFTTIFHLNPSFIAKFLIDFQNEKKKTNTSYILPSKILSYLTKDQLFELARVHPVILNNQSYIQLWFNQKYAQTIRKFVEGSNLFTQVEQQHKRKAFQNIIKQLQQYKHTPIIKAYANKLKSEVLVLDTIVNDPDIERLIDYLQFSQVILELSNIHQQYFAQFQRKSQKQYKEPKMRYRLEVDKTVPNQFIEEYIELLFRNGDGHQYLKKLTKYFNQSYLRKLHGKVRLYKGELIENANDYFSQEEIQAMKDKKQIRILPSNPKKYKIKDAVKLDVSIKNVKNINIKVYELNLEKHLLGESSNYSIDDQVQLSFLLPTAQERYQHRSTNPFHIVYTQLDLSKLIPQAMGVYIVDLQGETVTSRAVIRKGTIICVDTLTQAGQQFSFFDQDGKPLTKQQGLRVWIREQVAELTENKAFVAYSDKSQYGNIVASIGNYAEAFQKQFQQEKYKFQVGYIYNGQSFIVGRKAKVVLHGRLSLNEKTMSLELLRNTKVRVTVTNNQNIKTSFPFDIEKWNNSADQIIEFPIQAYTKQINIAVQTQITLQNGKQANLSSNKDINIDLGENSTNFLDLYLQQDTHKNYILNLLGANGEPISNADVILTFSIAGVEQVEKKQLKTNHEGRINLGPLEIVSRLSADINSSQTNIQRVWQIDQTQNNFNYNRTIHFKLGQKMVLPVNPRWNKGDVLLLKTFDKFCCQDLSEQLHYQNGRLTLPTMNEQGFYVLKMLPIDKTIQIVTLKNIPWKDDTIENQKVYDEDEGTLYQITNNLYQSIAISQVDFKLEQSHINANITLDLGAVPQSKLGDVRVHVLANNFVSAEISETFKTSNYNVEGKLKEHYLQIKKSAYYSNKSCSDEGAYVWNRQQKNQQLVGNNLQKPSIFLKRILVRETNQNNQDLNEDGRYQQECAMMETDPNMRQRFRGNNAESKSKINIGHNTLGLNSHNNFLLLSTDLANNLSGNQIKLQIPHGYNSIEVFVLTPKTAIKNTYALPSNLNSQRKDLRHVGLEDCDQKSGWTMSREISRLLAGEKRVVNRDSQWRTVGLADIFEFASTKRIKLYDWSNHLLSWHNLDDNKKRQIYDKQCCHELNTFIRFKDEEFFNNVAKNFIRNKIDKTIVDLCLLGDVSAIAYAGLNKLQTLNAFQKALLVHTLVQNKHIDTARSIVEALQLQQKSIKRNYEEYKNNFDTIINAKQTQEKADIRSRLNQNRAKLGEMKMKRQYRMASAVRSSSPIQLASRGVQMQYMSKRMDIMQVKKAFVPIQSTKEYTQKTYLNVKNYRSQAPRLIKPSLFWAELARSFLQAKPLITQSFMYLKTAVQFILASSFISRESSSNFELSNADNKYEIFVKSPMLIYVKQVKRVQHAKKFGVLINQRFFDPNNRTAYEEDGTQYQKEVEEFIIKKSYICQTVINNTSGTPLQLQVLLDIPRGTIPLRSHQYTQIINIRVEPYSSQSYERYFYIPEEGEYSIYPSNASRGSSIIAKANLLPPLVAKKVWTVNKLQSFEDVIRSGKQEQVINFLLTRNIFDQNIFKPSQILWMLKDKDFYLRVIEVLRKRSFYNRNIWSFGFLHKDTSVMKQIINFSQPVTLQPVVFQYFPYYSTRTHPFANESKSTIRNVQLKQTYIRFLVGSIIGLRRQSFQVSYCYFLILQDRLREANDVIKQVKKEDYSAYQIQYDYMQCFLDLSLNSVNFNAARDIIKKYKDYPIQSWRKLFAEVSKTIEVQDQLIDDENEAVVGEVFQTQVIHQGAQIKIIQPANTLISVQIFEINLQLYFSEYPFYQIKSFTSIKPSITKLLTKNAQTKETIIKRSDYPNLKDSTVQITQIKEGLQKKITSFWWVNPEVKVKINENEGTLQVFLNKKRLAGAYVKVFSDKGMNKDFYRDGYSDMTGTFRYAMSDLDGIKEFSILVMTERGGVIQKVKPPSKLASY